MSDAVPVQHIEILRLQERLVANFHGILPPCRQLTEEGI